MNVHCPLSRALETPQGKERGLGRTGSWEGQGVGKERELGRTGSWEEGEGVGKERELARDRDGRDQCHVFP